MSFDTRYKIISPAQAGVAAATARRDGGQAVAFVTHLEVLRAGHINALEHAVPNTPGKLFVVLTDPASPLAPLGARAELAAALRMVDYVVPSPEGAAPVLAAIQADATVPDEQEDRGRTRQLIEHVRSRSRI